MPLINMPATTPGPAAAIRHAEREPSTAEAQAAAIPR